MRKSAQCRVLRIHNDGSLHKGLLVCALNARVDLHKTAGKCVHNEGAFQSQGSYGWGKETASHTWTTELRDMDMGYNITQRQ